jgi:hypothetical protein
MALPAGEVTAALSGLRPDQARAKKRRSSARSAAGHGEEPAKDGSEVGGGGKSLACICGEKFSRSDALRRHIKEGSTDVPKHECPICRQMFKRPSQRKQHLRRCHGEDLPAAQELQLRPESGPASTVRAGFDHPGGAVEAVPGGSWNVPMSVSATGASWSGHGHFSSSAMSVLPAAHQGLEHVAPAFAPQSLTTEDQELAAYHPAYPAGTVAVAQRGGLPATHAPGSVGYPATLSAGGDPGCFNLDAASVSVGPADGGFGMTAPGNSFMGTFYGFGLDPFDV